MKKVFACAAALSLVPLSLTFLACGDDSSSNADGGEKKADKVVASVGECYLSSTLVGQDKAYLLGGESKGYQIVIPDLHVNNEWDGDELPAERNGDTLLIVNEEGTLVSLNWICYSDHQFEISAADADVKYFKLFNQVFEVVSDTIPERERVSIIESSSSKDDNSSSSVLDSNRNVSMSFKGCYESLYNKSALLKEGVTDELPKAYLYENDGKYQLMIPKIYDYCGFEKVMMDVGRSGDTLKLDVFAMIPTECFCTSDHWFKIDASDADIKFFELKLYNKEQQVYEVVPGPAPDEPYSSSVQPSESSSSVTPPSSSSGVTPPSSSSTVSPKYNGPVPLKSITATCQDGDLTYDPVEPSQPTAYLGISTSFAEIELFNVKLTYACDSASQKVFWDSLKADNTVASVIGDTLFVNFKRFDEKGVEYKCGCTAKVEFTFDEQYAGFGYTAFENNRPPLELGYKLVQQPDLSYQKVEEADAQCVKDGPDDPMVDAALPPVAHMYVNGDSAQIVIERVMVTCGTRFESVEVEMRDSSLYVTPHYDPSSMFADCLCSSKVSFNVKMVDVYKDATTLVYDDGTSINLGNKMRLIVE